MLSQEKNKLFVYYILCSKPGKQRNMQDTYEMGAEEVGGGLQQDGSAVKVLAR